MPTPKPTQPAKNPAPEFLPTPARAKKWCAAQRAQGKTIGYVPTMGALHRGHLALVAQAARENDLACVSIFINPLQFNNPADLQNYPRDLPKDLALLKKSNCAMAYTGTPEQFFPELTTPNPPTQTQLLNRLVPPNASPAMQELEGKHRPHHLQGVWAIVSRLFATIGECTAYFGEKDFQQTLIVRDLAKHHPGIRIATSPTIREPDGLALSSRNAHLTPAQRKLAGKIHAALTAGKAAYQQSRATLPPAEIAHRIQTALAHPQIHPEYIAIRDPKNWSNDPIKNPPAQLSPQTRALIAANIGGIRLIDNILLSSETEA